MNHTLLKKIKKSLSASALEINSTAAEKNPSGGTLIKIQPLTIEEYSAVAGGPQVENEPE
ncbi:hypothetical protein RugamoR57_36640 [Duganella caerulea]|uniref:hypothetical protein n=1 Tax=Duganella caerulea TaxID=2885762 RepID=UPI0030E878D1